MTTVERMNQLQRRDEVKRINTVMSIFNRTPITVGGDLPVLVNLDALRIHNPRKLRDGMAVIVSSQIAPGDRNGGIYVWDDSATAPDDGLTVIRPTTSVSSGRWIQSVGRGNVGAIGPKGDRGLKGDQGDGLAEVMAPGGSSLVGYRNRTVAAKLNDIVSVKDFGAKGDGATDDSGAVNAAILSVYQKGGGTIIFPDSAAGYRLASTCYIVSDVSLDAGGQKLIGVAGKSMFQTANVVNNVFVPIVVFDPFSVVRNAQIRNAKISGTSLAFDFISFTLACAVSNIEFDGCTKGFSLLECFYSRWENITCTPSSGSASAPFYHLRGAANAMVFDRITGTVGWAWLIENGATALLFNACTFEGGDIGFKFKGDNMGIKFLCCYFESVPGRVFDFSEAGACWIDFEGNFINGVDTVLDDGGATGSCTLFGKWGVSNKFANINGNLGGPFTYRARMLVSGPRNYIDYEYEARATTELTVPPNWTISKVTRLTRIAVWNPDGTAEICAAAEVHHGLVPVKYSGDYGDPFNGTIPFCTISSIPSGPNVSFTIDTKLTWRPLSLFAKVILRVRRVVDGVFQNYMIGGDILGDIAVIQGGIDPALSASGPVALAVSNNAGFLRLTIGNLQNPNGDVEITGTVRALS